MRSLSRMVWSDGMHLGQHHFQAQTRYFEGLTGFALDQLHFTPWGFAGFELDAEALLNGTVILRSARGIFPDGLPFYCPDDALPEPLPIRDRFSPTADSQLVMLAMPAHRAGQANVALEPGPAAQALRFQAESRRVVDEVTGQDERPVLIARKNLRLMVSEEVDDSFVTLPLARVRRNGAGQFVYDPHHIPPCLRIGASHALLALLTRIVEQLEARGESLRQERASARGGNYASREVAAYWLSHAIESGLAPLRHRLQTRDAHPESLYVDLVRLAGALSTFSMQADARALPTYRHDALEVGFEELERHIRANLEVVMPTNVASFALRPVQPSFFATTITDPRTLRGAAAWYLEVRASTSAAELISRVPSLVKVCSGRHIERLVREAFPGMTLTHATTLPDEISPQPGAQYFAVHVAGPCWTSIVESAEVGVYAPASLPDVQMELIAVMGA